MRRFLILILLCPLWVFAQEKQPKIGLVLSGGGAKGLAHIGILKEIDRAGLQIDYIGGTSIGAIIGGFYAAGYSGKQIETLVDSLHITDLLQDVLPRNTLPYFEKVYGEKHAISLPITKKGIGLPRAVSKGQRLLNLFNYSLTPVDSIDDFKRLPIPFFCVATDAETGKMVLLERGSLPMALRASGSFPTLLNPVEIDNQLLLDGGIANNFPIEIMREKGVDIMIGVNVQSDLNKRDKLHSVIAILNQIISYNIYEQSKKGLEDCDVYIKPDISNFTVVDFDKSKGIIKQGDIAGKKYRSVIDSLARLQTQTKERTKLILNNKKFTVTQIRVFGTENYTSAFVRGKLKIRVGDLISRLELDERINFLAATDNYAKIDYKVKNGELDFFVTEKKQKSEIRLGAHYDDLYKSALLVSYVHKRLLVKNDELSLDMIIGDHVRFNANYFVDNGLYTSFGINTRYNHFKTSSGFSFKDDLNVNQIELNYSDITTEAFLQSVFGRKFAVGVGVELKNLQINTETLTEQNNSRITFDNSNYCSLNTYLKLDSYNDPVFPSKGFYADVGGKWYALSSDYLNNFNPFLQLGGEVGFATILWKRWTFQYTNNAGFTFQRPTSEVFDFYLGGYNQNYINTFIPMYGYDFAQVSGRSYLKSEFHVRYRLTNNGFASFIANYARVDDHVFSNLNALFKDVLSGYAFGYGLDTVVGPIELKYSWSPENRKKYWLFNLGFWF